MSLHCWKVLETDGYYRNFIEKKLRPDEREWMKEREITLKTGSITTADGSATVRLGNTSVVCGIKAEIAVPHLRLPDEGFIVPNVELYPCCSPSIKAGPPGEKAIVTSKFLNDVIRNSGIIDLKSLCVVPNKVAWCLYCDVVCLDHDGNLPDSSLLALVAALQDTRLPCVSWDPEIEKIHISKEKTNTLELHASPISTTFSIYNADVHLLDPTAEDEAEGNGEVTFVMKDPETICSVHKSGGEFLTLDIMEELLAVAKSRTKKIIRIIEEAVPPKAKCDTKIVEDVLQTKVPKETSFSEQVGRTKKKKKKK